MIAGHRGRDPTFKLLHERFYWPGLYDDVAWFTRSCIECQKSLARRPVLPYSESWTAPLIRHFNIDTIHMPMGEQKMEYIFHAEEPTILWAEARAVTNNKARTMAKFIYEELICRFGCIPLISVDGGPEFKKEVIHLLKTLYRCTLIVSTPYHPEGNAPVERQHQTLVACIFKLTGDAKGTWPRYVHPALFAIRVTVSRFTGYSPFFLLYGTHPTFSFDIDEHTWQTLDWHKVSIHEELIELRAKQILRRDKKMDEAIAQLRASRRKAMDDATKRNHYKFDFADFEEGMYVWLREAQLDEIKGGKGEWTYSGPYIIHKKLENDAYILRELSGAVRHGAVNIRLLRLFFFRSDHQTLRTKLSIPPSADPLIINPESSITRAASYRILYGR
jgi:hypothetical protein